jgi:antitoxin component of MazEF toxin-antitoxin module
MASKIYGVVKACVLGKTALAVTIPHRLRKELRIEKGTYFVVGVDNEGRLVYERITDTDTDTDTDRRENKEGSE